MGLTPYTLHYTSPASSWDHALPVGNGRLGAMVYGRPTMELLQLNEDSVWYGGPQDRTPPDARANLPRLREFIRAGRHAEAEALVRAAFWGSPASMRHYEPLGTMSVEFLDVVAGGEEYSRKLDLETAMQTTEFVGKDGTVVRRDVLASYPDQVLVMRVVATRRIKFVIRITRVSEVEWETQEFLDSVEVQGNKIVMHATPGGKNSNSLCTVVSAHADDDGSDECSVEPLGGGLVVKAAAATIVLGAHTTFRHADPETAAKADAVRALKAGWGKLLSRHTNDYQSLFARVSLRLYPDDFTVPTDIRLQSKRDPGLVALYHNYGRYLLISCSRDGDKTLPATLQGIWNPSFSPAWGSKYTQNINLQMNYWPALPSDLFSCALPLVDLLERMAVRGRETAERMYGCKGWCAHHNTDIWADTSPQDKWMPSTLWPLGGVWVTNDVVEMLQFEYRRDVHDRVHAILEGCVEFLLDFLIPSEDAQYLVTNPSISPENTFITEDGNEGILCEGSVIDMNIVRLCFENWLWSVSRLGGSDESALVPAVKDALAKIPPLKINDQGLIQEWGLADYKEKEPGHRHVSHLFSLYPGQAISPFSTPDLSEAARRVLERRAAHGGGHTGWSRAWLLNLHARLLDAEGCAKHMELLLKDSTLPNMLDTHPPFQIDGNFGACAGVLECLVQSRLLPESNVVEIRLLPACPAEWGEGELRGVRLRLGWKVSFSWKGGDLMGFTLIYATEEANDVARVVLPNGEVVEVRGLGRHEIRRAGETG